MNKLEKIILVIINALGTMGQTWAHKAFDAVEAFVTRSTTQVDNAVFYKAVGYLQSWTPKNPPVE